MEKVKNYLNHIGLVLIFLALASLIIWPYKRTVALVLALLGVAFLVAYIILNLSVLKKSFKRKSLLYSSNLLLVVVLVLAILAMLNYIFARHHHKFDFTESKIHSLSDQSINVLKNLKKDIIIKCFFREGNYSRANMENLMKIYAYHSKKIKFEFIDPDKNPGLVKRYEITQDGTTILESGDKESRSTTSTEEDITNAVIKITREKKKVIYFLEGHGEESIEESGDKGYSQVKDELGKLGYEVKKLTLALADNFPKDCALLVIPGPEKDLLPNELDTIKKYLGDGGRVFFMVNPETAPGLIPYLREYGIKLENDLIVDTVSRLLGGDYFMPVVSEYESHDITKNFRYATFFPFARSVDVTETKPEGVTTSVLAKTSANSWSERQLDQKQASFDKDKDKQGPIPIAAVVTYKPKKEEKKENASEEKTEMTKPEEAKKEEKLELKEPETEGRLAVYGDSDFASNRYYNLSGNGNLFLNTINWLTEEADLISIQPKTSSPRTIQLTPSQGRMIFFTSLVILPFIVLITGISVWVRRRSL
jgi:ABC-type uncharacterized transport system involved in gliding motility auxiliary subunit